MKKNNKKGQAALEFLTTYGWAFLVILVMIGALSYFGVLDPTKFLPQRCTFGAELHCERYTLDSSSNVARFELKNALPTDVVINSTEWKTPENDTYTACSGFSGVTIKKESLGTIACNVGSGILNSGDKQRLQFKLTYSEGNNFESQFAKDLYGEIYANVR